MKQLKASLNVSLIISIVLLFIIVSNVYAQDPDYYSYEQQDKELVRNHPDIIIWNIKALQPNGILFHVIAIDKEGNKHPVKAIQDFEQTKLLDFKAFINGKQLPIKLLLKEDEKYYPLKAINTDGSLLDIKAITDKGEEIDIKGVSQSGNIINIEAILNGGDFYNIIAISPQGDMNIVKGIKMYKDDVEATVNGVKIFAHVKAIEQ